MRSFLIGLAVATAITRPASADDPAPAEKLPPPRIVAPAPITGGNLLLPPPPPIFYQHGTRDVWQNYAVDSYGRWRPRVIFSPYGSYYHADGAPYPWASTHPRSFRAVTTD